MKIEKNFHIRTLDGFRAISALLVFVAHAGLHDLVPGGFGVTVFFVLSGYLITTLLRIEYESTHDIAIGKFYLRRAYRILPPMYITLLIAAIVRFPGWTGTPTAGGVVAQLLHMTNYYEIFSSADNLLPYTNVMWSLAIEEHFYLLYPLLLLACLRRSGISGSAKWLLGLCAVVLIWRLFLVYRLGVSANYTYVATDTRVDSLLFGCMLGLWANPKLDTASLDFGPTVWAGIVIVALGMLVFSFTFRDEGFRETWRYTIQSAAMLPIFFAGIRYSDWPVFRWLEARPVRALGTISYTFYLLHFLALAIATQLLPMQGLLVQGLLGFALTVAGATAMYWLVERRLGALRRRLHG